MSIISKIKEKITESLHDHLGKVSSSTISSYFILAHILIASTVYLVIEIVNASTMWETGQVYNIPLEHIGIFSLILTHHLILLGIKGSNTKSLFPNITKTIEEKHYTGVSISKETTDEPVNECSENIEMEDDSCRRESEDMPRRSRNVDDMSDEMPRKPRYR